MKKYTIKRESGMMYFYFENPHNLPVTKAKAILYKNYKPFKASSMRRSGTIWIFDVPASVQPGEYIICASGYVGGKKHLQRYFLRITGGSARGSLSGSTGIQG